jgi:hypothetical protein
MKPTDSRSPEAKDLLEKAIAAVRETCVEDSLVDRCRRGALALAPSEPPERAPSENDRLSWFFLLALAASVLLVVNLPPVYASLPPSDRQLAAVHIDPDGRRMLVYSDLRLEPDPSPDIERLD